MKKITLALSALTLLAVVAYVASSRGRVNAISSTESSRATETISPATPHDTKIRILEAKLTTNDDDPDTHRQLAAALVVRAEATGYAADYDRAASELDRAASLETKPGASLVAARAALLLSRHRFGQARTLAENELVELA